MFTIHSPDCNKLPFLILAGPNTCHLCWIFPEKEEISSGSHAEEYVVTEHLFLPFCIGQKIIRFTPLNV